MDSWEVAFRDKSRRRFKKSVSRRAMKAAVLLALAACIVAAVYIRAAGIR